MNNIQSSPSFTSTVIPKATLSNLEKYTKELDRYFEVKGLLGTPQKIRNAIDLGQAGVGASKDGILIVGKEKSADKFIHRVLKEIDSNVKYIDDAPEMKIEGPVFQILG